MRPESPSIFLATAGLIATLLVPQLGCRLGNPFDKPAPIPTLAHHGFRSDIAAAARGNALFEEAWWSTDDRYIVTRHQSQPALRVWDAHDGRLIARITAAMPESLGLIDGPRQRFLGRLYNTLGLVDLSKFVLFDLQSGAPLAEIPDDPAHPAVPFGLTDDGAAVLLAKPGALEVWQLDPPRLLRTGESPLDPTRPPPGCQGGISTSYDDKHCWELSARGRYLALAAASEAGTQAPTRYFLVELSQLHVTELIPPAVDGPGDLAAFAFSHDERRLAIGRADGVWFYDIVNRRWGPFVAGRHQRNQFLGAMAFSADDKRLVTLGDQLQASVLDADTGALLGRWEPAFEDWEGAFRVSADGSRIVVYHFVSDTLEVLSGADARPLGYICPFFCNKLHNPIEVHYAISPDGQRVVASHRYGAGLFETDGDRLIAGLHDPVLPRLKRAGGDPREAIAGGSGPRP